MKKFLFFILSMPLFVWAQVLSSDNFDAYTLGPISTDITGATAGASGYKVYVTNGTPATSTNMDANSTQFVSNGGSTAVQLIGPNNTSGIAYVWKDGLDTSWTARTAGNDIITAEVDFTAVSTGTSQNVFYMSIFDTSGSKVLVGARISLSDLTIRPMGYYNNAGSLGNYYFGTTLPLLITPNTPSHIAISFNKTDGKFRIQVDGGTVSEVQGAATGLDVGELDIYVSRSATNAAPATGVYDNLTITATNQLLGVEDIQTNNSQTIITPNPVKESFSVRLKEEFNPLTTTLNISDMTGKNVASFNFADSYNVSHLAKGVYVVTITDGTHSETQKLIKK